MKTAKIKATKPQLVSIGIDDDLTDKDCTVLYEYNDGYVKTQTVIFNEVLNVDEIKVYDILKIYLEDV